MRITVELSDPVTIFLIVLAVKITAGILYLRRRLGQGDRGGVVDSDDPA